MTLIFRGMLVTYHCRACGGSVLDMHVLRSMSSMDTHKRGSRHARAEKQVLDGHMHESILIVPVSLRSTDLNCLQQLPKQRRTASTTWHYHGGCVVGRVVDSHLKTLRIDSLKVMDNSVFSISSRINPHATLMMFRR
ncbi:unnamed protein product [Vicia faba]|uniref:Glucose-methanol-choline oxidoreductase C-terminal domain-containing protein n=1 Tax=Vicia faba TaxID=3906 RepID=A0AAV0YT35_VICFA|nr:unnamed protein product [Vicia faba]